MNFAELSNLYQQPLFDLISQSREIHLEHWRGEEVQRCSLLSIKTGRLIPPVSSAKSYCRWKKL
jgi:biotin synthase